jgi:hypothetical protein
VEVPVIVNSHRIKAGERVAFHVQFKRGTSRQLTTLLGNTVQQLLRRNGIPIPLSITQTRVLQPLLDIQQELLTER